MERRGTFTRGKLQGPESEPRPPNSSSQAGEEWKRETSTDTGHMTPSSQSSRRGETEPQCKKSNRAYLCSSVRELLTELSRKFSILIWLAVHR